jgi:hypothetical protein
MVGLEYRPLTIGGISQIMDNQATKGYGGGYIHGILASVTFNGHKVAKIQ